MTDTPTRAQIDAPTETDDDQPDRTDQTGTNPDDEVTEARTSAGLDPGSETVRLYLTWGALGVCSLLAVFALVQFYGSVTATIDLWVDARYQPVMRAAFNLAVLLASLIGVSVLVRELS